MPQENNDDCKMLLESIRGEIKLMRAEVRHTREICEHRMTAVEKICEDHETRLRDAAAGVTQFRFWSSVTSGGSTAMSLLALLKSFIAKG